MKHLVTANPYIIKDTSREAIQKSLMKHYNKIESEREKERQHLLRYYEHNSTEQFVKAYFSGTSLKQLPAFTQNFLRRAVNRRALVYKKPPETIAPEKYNESTPDLDFTRRQAEKLSFLLGSIAIRSRKSKEWNGTKEIEHDILPLFRLLFLEGEADPVGIFFPIHNYGNARVGTQAVEVWTERRGDIPGLHFWHKDNKFIPVPGREGMPEEMKWINPYDIIPFTFVHRSPQIAGEWWVEGATDLMRANFHLDVAMTEMALAYRFDAVGIKWMEGVEEPDEDEELPSGIDKFMLLPEGASIGRLDGGDLDKLIKATKFFAETALQNNHLMIKWADTGGQAKSAEALKMENIENIEEREANVEDIWRQWERKRFLVDKKVAEVEGLRFGDKPAYHVNFTEPTPPMSQEEERKQWDWWLDRGIKSIEDYIKFKNPDAPSEELDKMIDAAKEREVAAKEAEKPKFPSLLS